mmetsp:Transcript_8522/g.20235  ORF Transcript_8522/g.20235 Transcript_8522/m.20235 type:complete len:470 (-) Transcript_8522:101-1510(-)
MPRATLPSTGRLTRLLLLCVAVVSVLLLLFLGANLDRRQCGCQSPSGTTSSLSRAAPAMNSTATTASMDRVRPPPCDVLVRDEERAALLGHASYARLLALGSLRSVLEAPMSRHCDLRSDGTERAAHTSRAGGAAPLVSVVVPTCSRWRPLVNAVRSVLAQTLRDVQIVVAVSAGDRCHDVDEVRRVLDQLRAVMPASMTLDVVSAAHTPPAAGRDDFGSRHQRWPAHHWRLHDLAMKQVFATPGHTRNAAVLASNGTYVAFLDDDDVYLPYALCELVRAQLRHNASFSHGMRLLPRALADGNDKLRLWHRWRHVDCAFEPYGYRMLAAVASTLQDLPPWPSVRGNTAVQQWMADVERATALQPYWAPQFRLSAEREARQNIVATSTVMLHRSVIAQLDTLLFPPDMRYGQDYVGWMRVLNFTSAAASGAVLADYATTVWDVQHGRPNPVANCTRADDEPPQEPLTIGC